MPNNRSRTRFKLPPLNYLCPNTNTNTTAAHHLIIKIIFYTPSPGLAALLFVKYALGTLGTLGLFGG